MVSPQREQLPYLEDNWLRSPGAAKHLHISEFTLKNLADRGLIGYYQVGKHRRYPVADLDKYLASVRVEATR